MRYHPFIHVFHIILHHLPLYSNHTRHIFVLLKIESDFEANVASDFIDGQMFVRIPVEHVATAKISVGYFEGVRITFSTGKLAASWL